MQLLSVLCFLHLVLGKETELWEWGFGSGFVLSWSDLSHFQFAFVPLGVCICFFHLASPIVTLSADILPLCSP